MKKRDGTGGGKMKEDQYLLSSVSNTLDILDLLNDHEELSLAEICKKLRMGKTSVFRMLYTLEAKQFVYKTPDAKYRLGMKFVRFGSNISERQDLMVLLRPVLQKLRDENNETSHLAILVDDTEIVFVGKEIGNTSIRMASQIGVRMPAYCTGTGKVLLAYLPEDRLYAALEKMTFNKLTSATITSQEQLLQSLQTIRANGYGSDMEESEVGLVCYAAPIRNFSGAVIAAISISGPSARMHQNREKLLKALISAAKEASTMLGYEK